ncbi:hypothetical protein [Legionella taurinensis]|uniref:J domain-containing protein n=1 Tax=Legionella taurinensis TaxID=70611 RepID=A0A3A5L7W8_9GAMM|nr:hypothetical protein [Legionella taurinensis]RJT49412.1 hypothetical protein D6J04_01830 [Legionella taurinensis]RJT69445.1 hypothetical protein D6J03_02090 [Legionella taurinensis]STY26684.1 Uncharacterised protein [Legionella taurinensis]
MKNFDDELNALVKNFADYDTTAYRSKPNLSLQEVEAQAIALFSQYLTQDGFAPTSINKHYKTLARWFHTDKLVNETAEKKWLNAVLSTPENDGGAFKLVGYVREQLINMKQEKKGDYFAHVSNMDELLTQLKEDKERATTRTQRALMQSIIDVLESARGYHATVSSKNPLWIKGLLHSLPYISGGICVGFYVKELALLYASIYLISSGGQWLERSNSTRWQMLGKQMKSFGVSLENAVLALLGSLVSLNYTAMHHIRYLSAGLGGALYRYLVPAIEEKPGMKEKTEEKSTPVAKEDVWSQPGQLTVPSSSGQQSGLGPQHLLGGAEFSTLEGKLVALPLEEYKRKQKQQYFSTWRMGDAKSKVLAEAVTELQHLDKALASTEKFEKIESHLKKVANHPLFRVESSQSAKALAMALQLARQLSAQPLPLEVTPLLMIEDQPKTEVDKEEDEHDLDTLYAM